MTPAWIGSVVGAAVLAAATVACDRPPQPAIAPAAKPQPPPVIPAPPKPPPAYVQDHYAKLEDCVHDWGIAQKCTPAPAGQAPTAFLGPIYAKAYREETQVQLRKEAVDGGYSPQLVTEASDRSISKSEIKP